MTATARNRLWHAGFTPGLPPKVRSIPFAHESWQQDAFGLTPVETEIVVQLCAALVCGHPGLTVAELDRATAHSCQGVMRHIQRRGFVEVQVRDGQCKVWRATDAALKRLGVAGWVPEASLDEQARWLQLTTCVAPVPWLALNDACTGVFGVAR